MMCLKHCVNALLFGFGMFNSPQMLSSAVATLWDSLEACSAELTTISSVSIYAGESYHFMFTVMFVYGFTLCLT